MPYPFIVDDGCRSQSRRPRQKKDCTVRALAIGTVWTYDQAYDLLKKADRRSHGGFHLGPWLKSKGYKLSEWEIAPLSLPAVKGERRMTAASTKRGGSSDTEPVETLAKIVRIYPRN